MLSLRLASGSWLALVASVRVDCDPSATQHESPPPATTASPSEESPAKDLTMSNFEPPGGGFMGDPEGVSSTPGAKGVDHNGIVVGRWKVAMFGCLDTCIPNTCMVMLCPAVSVAQICKRLGLANFYYVLLAFAILYVVAIIAVAAHNLFMDGVIVILTLGMVACIARLRWRVRFLFSLPGSAIEDCFYATFCGCCAIAQIATQVESYKPGTCHPIDVFKPRNTLEGYTFA